MDVLDIIDRFDELDQLQKRLWRMKSKIYELVIDLESKDTLNPRIILNPFDSV